MSSCCTRAGQPSRITCFQVGRSLRRARGRGEGASMKVSTSEDPLVALVDAEAVAGVELAAGLCLGDAVDANNAGTDEVLGLPAAAGQPGQLQGLRQRDVLVLYRESLHEHILSTPLSCPGSTRELRVTESLQAGSAAAALSAPRIASHCPVVRSNDRFLIIFPEAVAMRDLVE